MSWLNWDSQWKHEKEGRMGFRDLEAFNVALLPKQLWRLVNYSGTWGYIFSLMFSDGS